MNRFALILMFALLLLMSALSKKLAGPSITLRPKPAVIGGGPIHHTPPASEPQKIRHLPRTDN